ncbi:VOC family protein [Aureimonas jatrophae]|uniref:Methylmalonyl-CoA/ethylmalonyl-CoA epimerase n=1 Tax=Aureimonas jatrophae TaxID=1166073 RepID=A0A1H0FHC2_9HYPH|nr:VOC family protein [Aureimonas jatrophae]MBB3950016.1 methylmalonyl-CoA/ethylmalonyl-CoA epimerase [Aureimonas jatrophae]SDN94040.1 methylmalonyl-CoA/ethylmalonyl-CoA epimerase [Aureimonas jatrophae]
MKSDNPNVRSIKHMAFAVRDAAEALKAYAQFLHVPADTVLTDYPKSKNRVALFNLGGIEYQLCQSLEKGGRFDQWIEERGAEGLHHICYEVDSIDAALDHAQAQGASLRLCKACGVKGSHPHPEGYVAFLDNDAGGVEIEFMQVYTPEELEKYNAYKGI